MFALRIGILAVDGTTLAEVAPVRERFAALGAQVTLIVPGGGSILPISGRYYPAAGGHGTRCAITQVSPTDFDVLLMPDSITQEQLLQYPQALEFMRINGADGEDVHVLPIMRISYAHILLANQTNFDGLARMRERVLSGSARR